MIVYLSQDNGTYFAQPVPSAAHRQQPKHSTPQRGQGHETQSAAVDVSQHYEMANGAEPPATAAHVYEMGNLERLITKRDIVEVHVVCRVCVVVRSSICHTNTVTL